MSRTGDIDAQRARGRGGRVAIACAGAAVLAIVAGALWWPSGDSAGEPNGEQAPPAIALGAVEADELAARHQWMAAALPRLLAVELEDAYGVAATVESGARDAVTGVLDRDGSGRLRLFVTIGGETTVVARRTLDDLTLAAAAVVADRRVPLARRAPSEAALREAGTGDAEAWRWWRRARRAALRGDGARARSAASRASLADPAFALPHLERAATYARGHEAGASAIARAAELGADLGARWRAEIDLVRGYHEDAGDRAVRARSLAELAPDDVGAQLRAVQLADPGDRIRALEAIAARWPDRAAAHAAIAFRDVPITLPPTPPRSVERGARHAARAVELAPATGRIRAIASLVAAMTGEPAAAVTHAEIAAQLAPRARATAVAAVTAHLAAGDPAAAVSAAERLLALEDDGAHGHTPETHSSIRADADARYLLALLAHRRGAFADGHQQLALACSRYADTGDTARARACWLARAHYADQLGDDAIATSSRDRAQALPLRGEGQGGGTEAHETDAVDPSGPYAWTEPILYGHTQPRTPE